MLSIDEAIAKYKEKSNFYKQTTNIAYGLELEQLAEWLEELKALREEKSEFLILAKDNYEMGMESGYNKAIDDCKELTFREVVYCDSLNDRTEFRELAEQLKERNNE